MKKLFYIFVLLYFCINTYSQDFTPTSNGEIIKHTYYTLSYDEDNEQAEWVYYKLIPSMFNTDVSRTNNFRIDCNVSSGSASLKDYKGSGYDRGHLAPAGDMKISKQCMSESFYMSNMSPQTPSFNRGGWKKLESLVRRWSITEGELYVITGPIYNDDTIIILTTIGENNVTVPPYFYKIIYSPSNNKMIAFILPNTKIENNLIHYIVTVDLIESKTDINFFYQLNDKIENELESIIDAKKWIF